MARVGLLVILLHIGLYSCTSDQNVNAPGPVSDNDLEQADLNESIEKFHKILNAADCFQKNLEIVGKCNHGYHAKIQKLDFGIYYINEHVGTSDRLQMHLKYLVRDDNLIYGVIASTDPSLNSEFEGVEFCRDSVALEEYSAAHKKLYDKAYTPEQIIKELIENEFAVIIACGNATTNYGQEEIKVFKAVQAQDIDYVAAMLRSVSPERQLLGAIAVQKLIEDDFELPQNIIQIRDHILDKNSLISACVSCSYGKDYHTLDYLNKYNWELIPNIDLE